MIVEVCDELSIKVRPLTKCKKVTYCIRFNVYSSVSCEVCTTNLKHLHCHHDNLYLQVTKVLDTVLKARSHHLLHSHRWQLTAFVPVLKMKRSMGMFKAASDTPFCRFSSAISKPVWMVARSAHCLNLILLNNNQQIINRQAWITDWIFYIQA